MKDFTYQYSQPPQYQFSLDSIETPKLVSGLLKAQYTPKQLQQFKSLDLCSGCGVMGFEMNFHIPELRKWDFVEVQDVYREHFERNLLQVRAREIQMKGEAGEFTFININYDRIRDQAELRNKYDLVVCNPPYFVETQGKLSDSDFKRRCRFFVDSDLTQLVSALQFCLKVTGQAYLLTMDSVVNGFDPMVELAKLCKGRFEISQVAHVRRAVLSKLIPS